MNKSKIESFRKGLLCLNFDVSPLNELVKEIEVLQMSNWKLQHIVESRDRDIKFLVNPTPIERMP